MMMRGELEGSPGWKQHIWKDPPLSLQDQESSHRCGCPHGVLGRSHPNASAGPNWVCDAPSLSAPLEAKSLGGSRVSPPPSPLFYWSLLGEGLSCRLPWFG